MSYINTDGDWEPDEPRNEYEPSYLDGYEDGLKFGKAIGYLRGYTTGRCDAFAEARKMIADRLK